MSKLISAIEFANKKGLSDLDKKVIAKKFKGKENTEEVWQTVLSRNFTIKEKPKTFDVTAPHRGIPVTMPEDKEKKKANSK